MLLAATLHTFSGLQGGEEGGGEGASQHDSFPSM